MKELRIGLCDLLHSPSVLIVQVCFYECDCIEQLRTCFLNMVNLALLIYQILSGKCSDLFLCVYKILGKNSFLEGYSQLFLEQFFRYGLSSMEQIKRKK